MIDAKKYHVDADAVAVSVEDEDVLYHGAPLSAERIEEIVATVPSVRNLVPGGKSLSGDGKHSPIVHVRLPEQVRDELAERARARGVSVSKYARELIEAALKAS